MRVLVLGAGYAGLTLARKLERTLPDDVDLVVVDDTGTHLVQHEVHRVVRKPRVAEHITLDLEDVLESATILEGEVVDVDPDANEAHLADGTVLAYDAAAVCLGSETAYYDLPGVREHAIPCKRVSHARRIRESVLDAIALGGHAVVGGAGLSGIQVAGELAALRDEHVNADTDGEATVDENADDDADDASGGGSDLSVTLLEMQDAVAPGFPEPFQRAVHDALEDADVDVRTNATVERATADAVELAGGDAIEYDTFVWTGGIAGTPATGGERVDARADLRVGDSTFVVGDAGEVVDADGEAVPASAQSAIREARVAATNLQKLVEHRRQNDPGAFEPTLERFTFSSPGWLVSVGNDAVAQVGPTVLTGRAAVALKASVGAGYLSGIGDLRNATNLVNDELGLDPGTDDAP
ncbi:FAD-dependent oxidoreductase [Halorubellus sp. JP-L1]|uniref:NAD(P)/FAD-dependent oxidoreductase n=1 Tax=Halorubellus sp. JP-L1 TaxID=2715753 RepID=UPI001408A1FC|nr:FAD-dependent oxidoreductase [Halorubellus sp. JP-L1]NHN40159.1 FAD-dependent oxidoreductase [Halorubellus sp. JP-L1]